jgi:hypothetical protein
MAFVGFVQVPVAQADVIEVIEEAVVARVCGVPPPVVKVVEVMVVFQPLPLPVWSLTASAAV